MESIKINIKDPKRINAFLDKIVIPTKGNIYIQVEEPIDAPDGSIWINPEEDPIINEGDNFSGQDIDIVLTRNGRRGELVVTCTGLDPTESYKLYLYTVTRRKGSIQKKWQHHPNYDIDDSKMSIQRKGYGRIAGTSMRYVPLDRDPEFYPEVPEWMPNNGYLQTEWELTPDENGVGEIRIKIQHWFVPMIKPKIRTSNPLTGEEQFFLIGASNNDHHSLPFKFGLVRLSDGATSKLSDQTFSVGVEKHKGPINLIYVNDSQNVSIETLFTSISVR